MKNSIKRATAITMAGLMITCAGCGKKGTEGTESSSQEQAKTIVTIGDEKYTVNDMMYYIYNEEEMGSLYDEIYVQFYGQSYWEMPDEEQDNKTGEQIAKENIMENLKLDSIFYQEAVKAGYTLSEDDKKTARENYDEFTAALTSEQMAVPGMTDELLEYFERQVLVEDYKAQVLEESEFDYDEVSESVSKKKCREYDYEYYAIYKEDDDGKKIKADELQSRVKQLEDLQKQVKKNNDMEKLIPKNMESYLEYSDDYVVEEDGEAYGTYKNVDVDQELKSLENGQVSPVIETDFAYFVFRMNDNDSPDYYEEIVETAVSEAQNKLFQTTMENVSEEYPVEVDEAAWSEVTVGSMIYFTDGAEVEVEE